MNIEQAVASLYNAITSGAFDWRDYIGGEVFNGLYIKTEPTYTAEGFSGFIVHFLNHDIVDLVYTKRDNNIIFRNEYITSKWRIKMLDIDGVRYFIKSTTRHKANQVRLFKLDEMGL